MDTVENSKTLWKSNQMEVSGLLTGSFTAAERGPDNRRGLGGPQSQPEHGVGEIFLHPRQESNPSTLVV